MRRCWDIYFLWEWGLLWHFIEVVMLLLFVHNQLDRCFRLLVTFAWVFSAHGLQSLGSNSFINLYLLWLLLCFMKRCDSLSGSLLGLLLLHQSSWMLSIRLLSLKSLQFGSCLDIDTRSWAAAILRNYRSFLLGVDLLSCLCGCALWFLCDDCSILKVSSLNFICSEWESTTLRNLSDFRSNCWNQRVIREAFHFIDRFNVRWASLFPLKVKICSRRLLWFFDCSSLMSARWPNSV